MFSSRKQSVRRLHPGVAGNGYLTVALYKKTYTIHRLMQMVFLPETVGILVMNHRDGNKHNNRLNNLEAVTPSENNQHAWDSGRRKPNKGRGMDMGNSKLTDDQVSVIKERLRSGETCAGIASSLPVSRTAISCIKHNRTWKHIQ